MDFYSRLFTLAVAFISLLNMNSAAQKGTPYVNSFPMDESLNYKVWDMIAQPNHEMLFTCRKGLLNYNGSKWRLHTLPAVPLIMTSDNRNRIFIGFRGDFGLVKKDSSGIFRFQSLMPGNTNKDIIFDEIYVENDSVYVVGDDEVFFVDKNNQTSNFTFPHFDEHHGFFMHNRKLHVATDNGICSVDHDSIDLFSNVTIPGNADLLFHFAINNDLTWLGTSNNKLYQFNGESLEKVNIEDQPYLDETVLVDGLMLNDSLIALSTNIGGVLIINKSTGKTVYTINYTTGLPDDEVYGIYLDPQKGLWIAHGRGISRISFALPVQVFNKYPGLRGNMNAFTLKNNEIYLGTSKGLYYLTKQKNFKTRQVKVKVKQQTESPAHKEKTAEPKEEKIESQQPKDKKKKGRLRKFFRKVATKIKKPIKKIAGTKNKKDKEPSQEKEETQSIYKTKTIYSLQSISHVFNEVKDFEGKCFQLIQHNNQIIAASNTGAYQIENHKTTAILKNTYVNFIIPSRFNANELLVGTDRGIVVLKNTKGQWRTKHKYIVDDDVYSIAEGEPGTIWLGSLGKAYKLKIEKKDSISLETMQFPQNMLDKVVIRILNDELNFIVSSGIFVLNADKTGIKRTDSFSVHTPLDIYTFYSQPQYTWIKAEAWKLYQQKNQLNLESIKYLSLIDNIDEAFLDDQKNIWLTDNNNNLYKISNKPDSIFAPEFMLNVASIRNKDGVYIEAKDIQLEYENNALAVRVSSPFFLKNNAVKYRYKLVGLTDSWSEWSSNEIINFPFIPAGEYYLLIESKSVLGNNSGITKIPVIIEKPFRQTAIFFVLMAILLIAFVFLIIILRERKLKRDKAILEQKVRERTKTISEQNEEITAQRDTLAEQNEEILQQKEEITAQRDEIEEQKNRIEQQHTDIKKSITYAERIQAAILPSHNIIDQWLENYFIFFKPRDIVSGDFYWINKIDNRVIVVAADCTGHGVPGAFMSMLGVSFLNEIAAHKNELHANTILNELRRYVKNTLSQQGKEGEAKDGMDASIMIIDPEKNKAEFAGAFNSLYMIREGELNEIKADKMPVGIYMKNEKLFTNHEIDLKPGDTFYMLSDGFPDQFGGENGRKFMKKPFKRLLLNMQNQPMEKQKETLDKTFKEWIGTEHHQIDDVLVIGLRI